MKYYFVYNTIIGKIGINATDDYLFKISFNKVKEEGIFLETPLIKETYYQIREYLKGERNKFKLPFCYLEGTEWEKTVWQALLKIPYGSTKTYKDVAFLVGTPKAYRAVGNALRKNPLPLIVPCHRVIKASKEKGGYGGGEVIKEKLLTLEGVKDLR